MCIGSLPSICALINKSFAVGQLPSKWKCADITPLFKKGSKNCRNNYRQISLTSIVCKLAEQIVKHRIMEFWGEANIFNPNQFAYMKGRSTVTQLLSCFNDWEKSRNKRNPTDVLLLDSSKAFGSVPHRRLLHKLERHGIDGPLLNWFQSFSFNWSVATCCFARQLFVMDSGKIRRTSGNNFRAQLVHNVRQ